ANIMTVKKLHLKTFPKSGGKTMQNKKLELTTQEVYEDRLKRHILPAIGHLKMAKITPMTLQTFYNKLF
ncbi:N-terminal phage integrase SAM-like domain-containing protein, partial [Robinsoniella sp. KNHs210]|uniref:N-terminal phage integrase SAM-like domain-containing protein n=1 Tax=Robinsoniella sp. KNHs210 TaxID=1469950 RepID=UPI001FA80C49